MGTLHKLQRKLRQQGKYFSQTIKQHNNTLSFKSQQWKRAAAVTVIFRSIHPQSERQCTAGCACTAAGLSYAAVASCFNASIAQRAASGSGWLQRQSPSSTPRTDCSFCQYLTEWLHERSTLEVETAVASVVYVQQAQSCLTSCCLYVVVNMRFLWHSWHRNTWMVSHGHRWSPQMARTAGDQPCLLVHQTQAGMWARRS